MSDPSHADSAGLLAASVTAAGPGLSRRRVLRSAAGAGAVGLAAAVTAAAATPALADAKRSAADPDRAAEGTADAGPSEPIVVHLHDARSGEMDVFAGTRHTRVRDPELADRLARAAR